ncbi:SNF2 [Theobroma cacao]|nr:SNF2 [Theobroma cacao]
MESNSGISGSSPKGNGANRSKMTSTTAEGLTSLASAGKDSNCSRSSTREMCKNILTSPSPSSGGNKKQFQKPMFKTKRTPKWFEKRRMTRSMKRLDKIDRYFSCFSVSKMCEKVSGSLRYEKVKLVNPQELVKPHDNVKRVADHELNPSNRMRCDSRRYREWLRLRASKYKVSGSYGRLSVTSADACEEVKEEVIESRLLCSKMQRVDFDSTQQCYSCNAEPGNALHSVFPVQGGKELISELNMDQTEEYSSDVLDKESQLEIKTGGGHNACVTCMLGGKLLSCVGKGCKRDFHLSCLVPALSNYPPGVWHCIWCVKKKKELGVHSVSEVESIWDAREAVSDNKIGSVVLAMPWEKQYFVKYRGLAHVHNRWIPEKKLLLEAPRLVTKYNSKNQVIRWKTEWTVPHRLLQKRKLLFPTNSDENDLDCTYEWLVKWTGLGYEHATWELENSSFLTSPEAMKLMRDFEIRHLKSETLSSHSEEEKKEKCSISELSQLSFGGSPGEYDRYLSYVNKLLAHWNKCQNAVVYDDQVDQERVIKVILFVLSLQFTARKPILIISKSTALSVWESEFLRVASSANIIVYKGSKDVRSSIRSLEFYNESSSIMFEILLSSSDVVAEDLDMLKAVEWGAVVIDECQSSRMSRYFEQIKRLIADMRLLLVSGQIKDCSADYQNLLSLLDSGYELSSDHLKIDSNTNVYELKETFASYVAFECKSGSSRFVEYWVPVQLSYLQLEQYCATLLSNSMFLSSSLKSDPADALRECCDHPYLLDQSLQSVVTKGLSAEENLAVGIKVSGKLQLLDKILVETKARGLRSIGGSGRDSIGNILDDFICQRFGKYSYVRIDGRGYANSEKKAVVNMFNDKESGRLFLLLEDRACLPSIKLSAVDIVILFDSDWEPLNDIKALHRISIGSQFEQLKVFRLYSSFTVEEKILILAKEGRRVDSNIRTLNRNSCLRLLSWGASYLFNKLDEFHGCSKLFSVSNVSCEQSFLNAVLLELLRQLPCRGESNHSAKCSFITKVPQNIVYDGNISLFGEKEIGSMNHEPSTFSWQKLLEGRQPQWKLLSESSPRRKKFQYLDNTPRKSEFGDGGDIKKSQIVVNSTDDPTYPNWKLKGKRKITVANKKRKLAAASKDIGETNFHCSTDGKKDVNQNNQLLLKLGISKLCETLLLPENVRGTAVAFLEYIMRDYDVSWESVSTSQAYQISLCWTAADLLEHKINQNKSLALAKLRLNLDCREEEVDYIYSKLQSVAKKFAQCSENVKGYKKPNCSKRVCVNPQHPVPKTIPSIPSCGQSGTLQSASSNGPDESLTEKTVSSLPMRLVADHFKSDPELGGTEVIVLEGVRANNSKQHFKVGSPCDQPKDHALILDSRHHQSPVRLPTTDFIAEPSEVPQAQCNEIVTGNDLVTTTNATQPNEDSDETDAVTLERATVFGSPSDQPKDHALISHSRHHRMSLERATLSRISQHDSAVTHLTGDLNALEFTGTGQSLVEADINTVESYSLLCQETAVSLPLHIRSSSSESSISTIPASGIQHLLSSNQHALCQEAPVPRQPLLEVPLDESSGPPVMHSVTLVPQQPSASTPVGESQMCIENQRSTTTLLRSPNDYPCQVNIVRPVSVTPQPACSKPLRIELERIQKFREQTLKLHEDTILRLKSERDKEIEEICKKYDMLLQDAEVAFMQKGQDLEILQSVLEEAGGLAMHEHQLHTFEP